MCTLPLQSDTQRTNKPTIKTLLKITGAFLAFWLFFALSRRPAKDGQAAQQQASQSAIDAKKAKVQQQIEARIAEREKQKQLHQQQEQAKQQEISNGVGIREWSWKSLKASDGDLIVIKFTLTNNTPYKLLHGKFDVILWGERDGTILMDDSKKLVRVTDTEFTDQGYDFVPSNHIKKADIMVPIKKYSSSLVKSASLTLLSIDAVKMTAVDASLTKVGDYIDSLESQNIDVPPQSYTAQQRFLQLKKTH